MTLKERKKIAKTSKDSAKLREVYERSARSFETQGLLAGNPSTPEDILNALACAADNINAAYGLWDERRVIPCSGAFSITCGLLQNPNLRPRHLNRVIDSLTVEGVIEACLVSRYIRLETWSEWILDNLNELGFFERTSVICWCGMDIYSDQKRKRLAKLLAQDPVMVDSARRVLKNPCCVPSKTEGARLILAES